MGSVSDRKPAQAATVGPAITAGTTQTQAGATVLVKDINEVTVSGTNGDGVQLPPASKGLRVTIINADAAQTIQVWPASGDDIDGGATNAVDSSAITSGDTRDYEAINSSSWYGVGAASTGDALTSNPLSQFASTTSAQLAGVISNETGSGSLVFATSPTFVTPALGTPSSGTATNLSGTAASLTAGNVTTNANLTGVVTSSGNATAIAAKAIAISKLADGTDGELITWDSSGVIAAVAAGDSTQVLTSNGAGAAPTFQAAGGGSFVFLAEVVPTASTAVSFLNTFSATYDDYLVIGVGLLPAVDASTRMQFANSGSADTGSNYARVVGTNVDQGTGTFTNTSFEGPLRMTLEATSGLGGNFQMTIRNVNQASQLKDYVAHGGAQQSSEADTFQSYEARGGYDGGVVTGFEITFDGQNFVAQGSVRVYGIVKS